MDQHAERDHAPRQVRQEPAGVLDDLKDGTAIAQNGMVLVERLAAVA